MINITNYVKADSLEQAYELNQKKTAKIIGGMMWMKMGKGSVNTVIDLSGLGLDKIEETEDSFMIGSMVTLRQLETNTPLNEYCNGAVKRAVKNIVGVQFRNLATIGGSLWGRYGFSDVLSVMMSMDCSVELFKGGIVPIEEFSRMKADNDIIVRVIIKKTAGKFIYSDMRIQSTDFPVLNCAVSYMNGQWRAVIGARPGRAVMIKDDSGILSECPSVSEAETFADNVCEKVIFGSNMRGSAEYRKHLAKVLIIRGLTENGGNR